PAARPPRVPRRGLPRRRGRPGAADERVRGVPRGGARGGAAARAAGGAVVGARGVRSRAAPALEGRRAGVHGVPRRSVGAGPGVAAHAGEGDLRGLPRRRDRVQADGHDVPALPRGEAEAGAMSEPAGPDLDGPDQDGQEQPAADGARSEPTAPMPRDQRAYVIAMCAIIGGAFAYAACEWGSWPRLTYLPLRGEVTLGAAPGISIVYLGVVA